MCAQVPGWGGEGPGCRGGEPAHRKGSQEFGRATCPGDGCLGGKRSCRTEDPARCLEAFVTGCLRTAGRAGRGVPWGCWEGEASRADAAAPIHGGGWGMGTVQPPRASSRLLDLGQVLYNLPMWTVTRDLHIRSVGLEAKISCGIRICLNTCS